MLQHIKIGSMSNFVVSARKYRPITFEDVVGQEHVTNTLKNALRSDHLAHAFLFCGPRGVGKTTCARILAKVINCQNPGTDLEPCNTCSSCTSFNDNASFNITELDAASNNSVEHIRALIEQVRFQPQQGKYKVFIIDEVHMLSQQAFNAFLKTLEEPPSYAIFILATTEKHKIIPTILSRCQIFDFKRIQAPSMVRHLQGISTKENIVADEEALHVIAQKADGALRDALSIFDRIVAYSGQHVKYEDVILNLNVLDYDFYFKIVDALLVEDMSQVMLIFDEILTKGFESDIFINGLAEHLRNLLMCKDAQTINLLELTDSLKERYRTQAHISPSSFLLTAMNLCNDCDINFRMARNKRLHVEMALIKMTYINRAVESAAHAAEKKNPEPDVTTAQTAPASTLTTNTEKNSGNNAPSESNGAPPEQAAGISIPKSTAGITPAHLVSTPRIGRLDDLMAEVHAEKEQFAAKPIRAIDQVTIEQAWAEYLEKVEQETTRNILRGIPLFWNEPTLTAKVTSNLVESTLRQERNLMEYLRQVFGRTDLILQIDLEKTPSSEKPKPIRPLNNKERLLAMYEKNPQVKELAEKLGLRFDGD
jgi:DNA polymerase-3 subunit gamma/tau